MNIDSLVVTLGLDASNFTKGQKEALEAFKRTQEGALAGGKAIEESSKRVTDAVGGIKTQALELFALFAGGKGVVSFVTDMTRADAAVGRLSRSTGIAINDISAWQGAARVMGGDAASMAASFVKMNDAFELFKGGISAGDPALMNLLSGLGKRGGTLIDPMLPTDQVYIKIAENLEAIRNKEGEGPAGAIGRLFGFDPGLLDMLMRGGTFTNQMLQEMRAFRAATKESADAAGELSANWEKMLISFEGLFRSSGASHWLAKFFGDWAEIIEGWSHGKLLKGSLADKIVGHLVPKLSEGYTPVKGPSLTSAATSSGGAFASQAAKENFIRSEAIKRGIDPDVAMAVARSEGFNNFVSTIPGETSYSAFQLHVTPGNRGGHLGDMFKKETGLDPSDRANEARAIIYALDNAHKIGWRNFHGAANNGIGNWQGIDRNASNVTNINGPITINAGANATGSDIADKIRALGMKRQAEASQSPVGGS